MEVSVIILNYNVKYHLDACIQTVQKALENIKGEIIVADNHSTDGSKDYFNNKYPEVKFLWFNENYGFAKAYNKAVKHAKGKYLFILNPDTLVAENSIQLLLDFAKTKENLGIIGGKMIDGTGNFLPESKRSVPTPWVAFGKLTGLYKILKFAPFNQYYAPYLQENETGKTEILTGAFMFLKKSVYEETGGFDERYFMYGEDIDFSYSVLQSGKENFYYPQAKIIHFKGESALNNPKYAQNFIQTTFQFYEKHFRPHKFLKSISRLLISLWFKLYKNPKKKDKTTIAPTNYLFFGKPAHSDFIRQKTGFDVHVWEKNKIPQKNSIVIFDTSVMSISEIISYMEKYKQQAKYRFYFPASKLLLGSDAKDMAGVAVNLS